MLIFNNKNHIDFIVTKFEDIIKIISFFEKYPIIGVKALDFADWCEAVELMKKGAHLTSEGLEEIKKIKEWIEADVLKGSYFS